MNKRCLYCTKLLEGKASWLSIFYDDVLSELCNTCIGEINYLRGKRCTYCSRMLGNLFANEVCTDCQYWFRQGKNYLEKNQSIFAYNEFMKEIITLIKYRGDCVLASGFAKLLQMELKKYLNYICMHTHARKDNLKIIPIPLSKERLVERGFNQVELLMSYSNVTLTNALKRINNEKQAKKTRQERLQESELFQMDKGVTLTPVVLLVDDLYTTGSTLQKAAKVLKGHGGVKLVYSFTLIRG